MEIQILVNIGITPNQIPLKDLPKEIRDNIADITQLIAEVLKEAPALNQKMNGLELKVDNILISIKGKKYLYQQKPQQ